MNILVTNDDGIQSKALKQLVIALSEVANVYVVAPEAEKSGNSHHTTFKKTRFQQVQLEGAKKAYALWSTPADCTRIGLFCLIEERIDAVVSGINVGPNHSVDITYSGTCAAAREAFINGIPSIAVSQAGCYDYNVEYDFSLESRMTVKILLKYLQDPDKYKYYLNINFPFDCQHSKGIMVTRPNGKRTLHFKYKSIIEDGIEYVIPDCLEEFKECFRKCDYYPSSDNDRFATDNGYISLSALYIDHNARDAFDDFKKYWNDYQL